MATKSTPDGVDLKLSNYSTTAAINGSIASANNATLPTTAQDSGGPALPRHSGEDHASGGGASAEIKKIIDDLAKRKKMIDGSQG